MSNSDDEQLDRARQRAAQQLLRRPEPEALSKEDLSLVLSALTATPAALELLRDVYQHDPKALPGLPRVIREVELSIKILRDKGVELVMWPADP